MVKSTQRIFQLGLLVVFGLLITGCLPKKIGDNKTAKTNIPSDWLSYENSIHGFGFKYPPDWDMKVITDTDNFSSISLKKEDDSQEQIEVYTEKMLPSYSINITVEKNQKGLSSKEYHLANFSDASRAQEEAKIEEITVAGLTGVKYVEGAAPSSGPATGILVVKDSKAFRFIYSALAHQETHTKYLSLFEQILASVNFK